MNIIERMIIRFMKEKRFYYHNNQNFSNIKKEYYEKNRKEVIQKFNLCYMCRKIYRKKIKFNMKNLRNINH